MLYCEATRTHPVTGWVTPYSELDICGAVIKLTEQVEFNAVISVQADGDELAHIRRAVTGLPDTGNNVVKWYGAHAQFIVGNLCQNPLPEEVAKNRRK